MATKNDTSSPESGAWALIQQRCSVEGEDSCFFGGNTKDCLERRIGSVKGAKGTSTAGLSQLIAASMATIDRFLNNHSK